MTRLFFLVSALGICVSACSKSPRDQLQGRWIGQGVSNVDPALRERTLGWVRGMSMEFLGSKVTVSIPAESPRTGVFKVTESTDKGMTVRFMREEGGSDDVKLVMNPDKSMTWDIGDGRSIELSKIASN